MYRIGFREFNRCQSLTCRQLVTHAGHGRLRADFGGVVVFGQFFTFGKSEVSPTGYQDPPSLVILDGRPIVEAVVAPEGHTILLANLESHGIAVVQRAVGEGVLAEERLQDESVSSED